MCPPTQPRQDKCTTGTGGWERGSGGRAPTAPSFFSQPGTLCSTRSVFILFFLFLFSAPPPPLPHCKARAHAACPESEHAPENRARETEREGGGDKSRSKKTQNSTPPHAARGLASPLAFPSSLSLGRPLHCCLIPDANVPPVDDLPHGLQIVRPHILVLQVIAVLPAINPQQRG